MISYCPGALVVVHFYEICFVVTIYRSTDFFLPFFRQTGIRKWERSESERGRMRRKKCVRKSFSILACHWRWHSQFRLCKIEFRNFDNFISFEFMRNTFIVGHCHSSFAFQSVRLHTPVDVLRKVSPSPYRQHPAATAYTSRTTNRNNNFVPQSSSRHFLFSFVFGCLRFVFRFFLWEHTWVSIVLHRFYIRRVVPKIEETEGREREKSFIFVYRHDFLYIRCQNVVFPPCRTTTSRYAIRPKRFVPFSPFVRYVRVLFRVFSYLFIPFALRIVLSPSFLLFFPLVGLFICRRKRDILPESSFTRTHRPTNA